PSVRFYPGITARHFLTLTLDCFASLAMTKGLPAMTGDLPAMTGGAPLGRMENGEWKMENVVFWKWRVPFLSLRTCGNLPLVKQSRRGAFSLDCFASLAMTRGVARNDGGLARNERAHCS
ncbi:MAG: hypothetical protein LBT00_08100, partial [Spirochaetaceae bacterium]|nr:hypothetical protein [Spirochaetaceae bacterium]